MFEKKDVQCEYLSDDKQSCNAIIKAEGQRTRSQDCSAERKDLCCYLCVKKETCDISCSLLDQTEQEEQTETAQASVIGSQDGEEKALACPVCNAPYRKLIHPGATQIRCDYCGAAVLVPPHLGGPIQHCPNHPDVYATSVCNDCGQGFCDSCLYVFDVRDGRLYLCPECYESRRKSVRAGYLAIAILPAVTLIIALMGLTNTQNVTVPPSVFAGLALFGVCLFLIMLAAVKRFSKQKPQSIHDLQTTYPPE